MIARETVRPIPERAYHVDCLRVEVYVTRAEMGRAAALDVARQMRSILAGQPRLSMIFAAAPSQNELLAELVAQSGLE